MGKKLFLSTLAIVLLTLALSSLSLDYVFKRQFGDYLTSTTEAALEQLPQRLLAAYKQDSWNQTALEGISESLPLGTDVTLKDPQGQVVATLMNPMDVMHKNLGLSMGDMAAGNVTMGDMMGMGMPYSVQDWKSKTILLSDGAKNFGTVIIRYPASARILNPQDISFISSVFYSLLAASSLALLIGILLSYFTSRHLVTPLQRLTQAAYRIGQGQFEERVPVATKDEVGQLADAFNAMADNLKRQEELRKQFTADIAHELRTPLTSIRSYIEAFQDGVLPANPENLSALNEEIDRLVGLASDLKDLNIAEMGKLTITPLPVNLNDLIDRIIRNLSPLLQEKGLGLNWEPARETVIIPGDERLLTRLFYNLIHNAYKYTEEGGHLRVSIIPESDSVTVKVEDSGIGIPEDELSLIFERFYRTDKSRARETGGSGIGLALVRQIVLLHNGKISVQSQVGQGTCFRVTLPRK